MRITTVTAARALRSNFPVQSTRTAYLPREILSSSAIRAVDNAYTMASQVFCRKLTPDLKARINKAQGIKLTWNDTCSPTLLKVVKAHADAVGSPKDYIFFPLITVAASFMGVNSRININEEWSEPAILWNVVAARKGEKKTAALKRLLSAVEVCMDTYLNYYKWLLCRHIHTMPVLKDSTQGCK